MYSNYIFTTPKPVCTPIFRDLRKRLQILHVFSPHNFGSGDGDPLRRINASEEHLNIATANGRQNIIESNSGVICGEKKV